MSALTPGDAYGLTIDGVVSWPSEFAIDRADTTTLGLCYYDLEPGQAEALRLMLLGADCLELTVLARPCGRWRAKSCRSSWSVATDDPCTRTLFTMEVEPA
jgi:hypothetical protein